MRFDKEKATEALREAQKGNQSGFAYLYEAYYQHAFVAAREILRAQSDGKSNYEECEDVVQETFLKCFQKLESIDLQAFGSYLKKTAQNTAIDHIKYREAQKRPDEVLSSFQVDEEDDGTSLELMDTERSEVQDALLKMNDFNLTPEEAVLQNEVKELLTEVLGELPETQQEALSLYYIDGLKIREIADIYGVPVDTANSYIKNGRRKVKEKIETLEKTKGIRLHSLAPIPFFFWLLRQEIVAEAAEMSVAGGTFVGANTVSFGMKKGIAGGAKSFFSKTITVAGKTVSVKAATVAVIGIASAGIVSGAVLYNNNTVSETVYEEAESDEETEQISVIQMLEDGQYESACVATEQAHIEHFGNPCNYTTHVLNDEEIYVINVSDGEQFTRLLNKEIIQNPIFSEIEGLEYLRNIYNLQLGDMFYSIYYGSISNPVLPPAPANSEVVESEESEDDESVKEETGVKPELVGAWWPVDLYWRSGWEEYLGPHLADNSFVINEDGTCSFHYGEIDCDLVLVEGTDNVFAPEEGAWPFGPFEFVDNGDDTYTVIDMNHEELSAIIHNASVQRAPN